MYIGVWPISSTASTRTAPKGRVRARPQLPLPAVTMKTRRRCQEPLLPLLLPRVHPHHLCQPQQGRCQYPLLASVPLAPILQCNMCVCILMPTRSLVV